MAVDPLADVFDLSRVSGAVMAQLIAYEKSHAARADVISMFERRVAKLAEG